MNKIWTILCCLAIFSSCGLSKEEMLELARQECDRKLAAFEKEQRDNCKRAVLGEAERQADSIIISMDIDPMKEDLYRPTIPPKPDFVPTDTIKLNSKHSVKPIVKK